jgi:GAF domain-containing protein
LHGTTSTLHAPLPIASPTAPARCLEFGMLLRPMLARLEAVHGLRETLGVALQHVVALHGAEMGNIQMFDAAQRLVIVAQWGLSREFVQSFDRLPLDAGTVCARAARRLATVFVPDVENDALFAPFLGCLRSVHVRAVLSSPLVGSDGRRVGVVSAHFANRYAPTRLEVESLERYCRRVADVLAKGLEGTDWSAEVERLASEMQAEMNALSRPVPGSAGRSLVH